MSEKIIPKDIFIQRRVEQLEKTEGEKLCEEKYNNIMEVLEQEPIDYNLLKKRLLEYKVVKEDCPMLWGVSMPREYDERIKARLKKKGVINLYS
jgi:hypothetical protein